METDEIGMNGKGRHKKQTIVKKKKEKYMQKERENNQIKENM